MSRIRDKRRLIVDTYVVECFCSILIELSFIYLQYYEMSYGLNVEMHKQASI